MFIRRVSTWRNGETSAALKGEPGRRAEGGEWEDRSLRLRQRSGAGPAWLAEDLGRVAQGLPTWTDIWSGEDRVEEREPHWELSPRRQAMPSHRCI